MAKVIEYSDKNITTDAVPRYEDSLDENEINSNRQGSNLNNASENENQGLCNSYNTNSDSPITQGSCNGNKSCDRNQGCYTGKLGSFDGKLSSCEGKQGCDGNQGYNKIQNSHGNGFSSETFPNQGSGNENLHCNKNKDSYNGQYNSNQRMKTSDTYENNYGRFNGSDTDNTKDLKEDIGASKTVPKAKTKKTGKSKSGE